MVGQLSNRAASGRCCWAWCGCDMGQGDQLVVQRSFCPARRVYGVQAAVVATSLAVIFVAGQHCVEEVT